MNTQVISWLRCGMSGLEEDALDELCLAFDLGKPIWLDANIRDFQRHKKTRFTGDNFIEEIDFDFLEILVLEE